MNTNTQTRLHNYLDSLRPNGHDPDNEPWIVNIFGAQPHGMLARSPCLTKARAATGSYYITNRSRLMSTTEMLRLQGMSPGLNWEYILARQTGCMVGNAMSVNMLERLLARLLPATGLVNRSCLHDHRE